MSRSKLREKVFQLLFRAEFNTEEEMKEQIPFFFEDEEQAPITEKEREQITQKCEEVLAKISEIDEKLNENMTGWNTSRVGKVELAIMRLAVYEILFDENVPASVAINEAIELAKKYAQDESPAFINGVLAKFAPKKDA